MRQTHDPTPKARISFLPFLWFTWAVLGFAALILGGFFLASLITVPQTERFVGTLQPNQTPTKLQLPAGVPLKELLVKSGELVRAGQTVAILDEAAMRAQLSHINRSIVVANVLRACLLRPNETRNEAEQSPHESRVINPPETERDQELELLIRAAQADCDAGQREDQTRVLRLERALGVLQARLALLNQKLAMVLGVHVKDAKKEVHSVLRAHASVDVALDRNALIQDLNTLTSELDMARSKQYRARLMRIGHLSTDVALKITQKAVLETYLENPRLTVPQSGHVSRIRPVPVGTRFDTEETIIEIQGSEAEQFVADLRVPLAQVSILPVGTQVTVSLAGFTENGPILNGAIEYWAQADTEAGIDYAVARIGLAKESQKLLANPRNGIALRGTSTASVIRAQLEPKTLQATLIDSISNKSEWVRSLLSLGAFGAKSTQHPL